MKPDNKTDRVEEVKKKLKEDAIKKEDARQRTIDEINKDEEIRRVFQEALEKLKEE